MSNGLRAIVTTPGVSPGTIAALQAEVDALELAFTALDAEVDALPRGRINSATKVAAQNGISTIVDIASLTVTFTPVVGRRYRTIASVPVTQITSTGAVVLVVADAANTVLQQITFTLAATFQATLTVIFEETGLPAVSTTRKLRVLTTGGTVNIPCAASIVGLIAVDDVGV